MEFKELFLNVLLILPKNSSGFVHEAAELGEHLACEFILDFIAEFEVFLEFVRRGLAVELNG